MKETKVITYSPADYMNDKPVVQIIHTTDYGIKTLRLWIDGEITIGADKVQDDERNVYLSHFGSEAARASAIATWIKARTNINFDDRGRLYKCNNTSVTHDVQTMSDTEIAAAKIDRYASRMAYELTIEKYPEAEIRMVHHDIVLADNAKVQEIKNYFNRAHHKYVTLVCHGKDL